MGSLSRRLVILVASLALLTGLVRHLPAGVALGWFLPATIQTRGVSGTLWKGHLDAAAVEGIVIGPVDWQLNPWTLLTARVQADVEAGLPGGFANGEVTLGWGTIAVSDLRAQAALAALTQRSSIGSASGTVRLRIDRADVKALWPELVEGQVDLLNLQYVASGPAPLGNFKLTFDGEPSADGTYPVFGTIASTGDSLFEVDGTLGLGPERSYSINAGVNPSANAPANTANMLNLMPKRSDGSAELRFEGRLD